MVNSIRGELDAEANEGDAPAAPSET